MIEGLFREIKIDEQVTVYRLGDFDVIFHQNFDWPILYSFHGAIAPMQEGMPSGDMFIANKERMAKVGETRLTDATSRYMAFRAKELGLPCD